MNQPGIDPLLASGVDHLNVVASRDDVERCDIREVAGTLGQLVQTRDRVHRFRHRVSLFIDGYNSDSRELYEIPEVREYISALDAEFPYWFWFLNPRDSSLLIVAAGCCDLQAHRTATIGHVSIEPVAFAGFAMRHFDALNRLARVHGISDEAVAEISDVVMHYFGHTAQQTADSVGQPRTYSSGRAMLHEEFVRRYHAGELEVHIPEEMVDEVLAKRNIDMARPDRTTYMLRRSAGAIAWILSMLSFISGRLALGAVLLVAGLWLVVRNDKIAGNHVLSAVLRDRKLYDLLQEHHGLWISERRSPP